MSLRMVLGPPHGRRDEEAGSREEVVADMQLDEPNAVILETVTEMETRSDQSMLRLKTRTEDTAYAEGGKPAIFEKPIRSRRTNPKSSLHSTLD